MRTVSLIAALALGAHALEEQLLPFGKQQQQPTASLLPPRPGQQPAQQGGAPPPRAGTPTFLPQQSAAAGKQQGGLLGNLLGGKDNQSPAPQQGGLLGGLLNKPANQPAPAAGGGGLLGGLIGGSTKPIAVKQCPATSASRCRGRESACVPHPNNAEQYLCVKIEDDCGGRRNRACPSGQACLADPRDRDACVNGWCNNTEGICVTPPK